MSGAVEVSRDIHQYSNVMKKVQPAGLTFAPPRVVSAEGGICYANLHHQTGYLFVLDGSLEHGFWLPAQGISVAACLAWCPVGKMLACSLKDKLFIIDVHMGGLKHNVLVARSPTYPRQITRMLWNPSGDKVAVCCDGDLAVFNAVNGIVEWYIMQGTPWPHNGLGAGLKCLAWCPSGKYIATGCYDGFLRIASARTGQLIQQLRCDDECYGDDLSELIWNPNGKCIAVAFAGVTKLFSLSTATFKNLLVFDDKVCKGGCSRHSVEFILWNS